MTGQLTMQTRLSAKDRALLFFEAWRNAPPDADIEIRIGHTAGGDAAVLVSVGADMHAFTADEANTIARIAEGSLKTFGEAALAEGLDNLVMGLRAGAKAASLAHPTKGDERE